jgi:hypothetical protein
MRKSVFSERRKMLSNNRKVDIAVALFNLAVKLIDVGVNLMRKAGYPEARFEYSSGDSRGILWQGEEK